MEQGQAELDLDGNLEFWNSAEKKGYSGTAVFTPHQPLSVTYGMDKDVHDHEGRLITLEYQEFYLVCCYTPNSQDGLKRLDYRMEWEDDLREYLMSLDKNKPVIYCGDLNVAHKEIDLKNPKTNIGNPGFSYEERDKFTELLQAGFTFHVDSPTNQLFPIFTDAQWEKIEELGFKLEFNGRLDEEHVVLRVCTSWYTPDEYVDKFIDAIQDL